MRKVNMVLGVFFSEVGIKVLQLFSGYSHRPVEDRAHLLVKVDWPHNAFARALRTTRERVVVVDMGLVDLVVLRDVLNLKRGFLVSLLENPVLLENEGFSEALLAVFHLADELNSRDALDQLPNSDRKHLAGDIDRAYRQLTAQWLLYLRHLKDAYPYLFSLAIRKNPFDPKASPIVR